VVKHNLNISMKITGTLNQRDTAIISKLYAETVQSAVSFAKVILFILVIGKVLHWLRWW